MGRKKQTADTDFLANPDNVVIGDWVTKIKGEDKGLVGEIVERVKTGGKMLQFWVRWFSFPSSNTAELASNLKKVSKQDNGYVGKSTIDGLITQMIIDQKTIKYKVRTNSKEERLLTRRQIEKNLMVEDEEENQPIVEIQIDNEQQLLTYEEQNDRLFLERKVERAFYEAGKALQELRDRRLYRSTHKTFEEYCKDRFGFGRSRSCRLIDAVAVCDNLSYSQMLPNGQQKDSKEKMLPIGSQILPSSERQVRPLTKLEPEQQREVWKKAVGSAGGKIPSGRIVSDIVERIKQKVRPPNPYHVGDICRIIALDIPELRGKGGQWCIVDQIHEFSCTVKVYQGEMTIALDNLRLFDCSTADCEAFAQLCDRLHQLYSQKLEEIAISLVDRLAKLDRASLTPLEEGLLKLLESHLK